jgi:hypothetical protein
MTHRLGELVWALVALLLAILLLSPGPAAAQHDSEWTVVTLARDGSWGTATSELQSRALASALRKCKAMSDGRSDCGAEIIAIRKGWTLGILCGDHRILVAATDLITAIRDAQARELHLWELYGGKLPICESIVTVDPQGFASASRKKPWGAARTGASK